MEILIRPNLQLIYVSDILRSTAFYSKIFNSQPIFSSPRYVAFSAGENLLFSLWSGGNSPDVDAPRFSEIGIMLPSNEHVDKLYEQWCQGSDIKIFKVLYTDVFGSTFLAVDPDGHIIRVCPLDSN